ncbi:MAG: ABC transporter permease [SAR202 cluster bacterium]|jgi:ABC-type nitrate/sulfonate/bicarbonate transport system permease component|nr:ABC transporter permease [SAR202 cluster bacterium]MDP6513528.1 ABC transporter permease [SAR202 cluster bacterium]
MSIIQNVPDPSKSRWRTALISGAIHWTPAMGIVIGLLSLWETYVRIFDVQKWLLPAPSVIAITIGEDAGLLTRHTWATVEEIVIGFGLALICGVGLATAIGLSRTLERALYPFVIASQTIPIIVIAPMLLIWVGYGLAPKVIVVALISFFPIVVNMVDGLKSVDPDEVSLMQTLGANRWQIFLKLQTPTSMPLLFSGMRVAIAVSVIGAVIGEWVGSSEGLGYLMIRSKPQFLTERVFAAIAILSAMGVGLFALVGLAERLALPWRRGAQGRPGEI